MAFRDLKQNRQQQLEKIAADFAKHNSSEGGNSDPRKWYPETDKAGNGKAVIRFLPAPDGEDSPTVKLYQRSFKGPTGKWYINNCLTTIGKDDPVNELNRKLVGGLEWEAVPDKVKEVVRNQKRKTLYISNILVIKDPANPENEGKVFLYNYGPVIRDIINEKMNPTFEGEERVNPFDMYEGANFVIKITRKDKYRNYDKSEFEAKGPLFVNKKGEPDEAKMEEVYNQMHKLQPFLAADQFKSYEELEKQLEKVLGNTDRVKPELSLVETSAPSKAKESKPAWEDEDDDGIDPSMFKDMDDDE